MDDEDGYFGASIAATYDESSADMFDPAVVEPAVDLLAELAGPAGRWSWPSAPGASRSRSRAGASQYTASTCPVRWWPG